MTTAHCDDCGRQYGDEYGFPDLIIPNYIWRQISPSKDNGGLLCPSCIVKRVSDLGSREVPAAFMSGPLRSVDPELMNCLRWVENLREQGHGWYCPECGGPRHVCGKEQELANETSQATAVEGEDSPGRNPPEDTGATTPQEGASAAFNAGMLE